MRTRSMGWILALGFALAAARSFNPSITSADDEYLSQQVVEEAIASEDATASEEAVVSEEATASDEATASEEATITDGIEIIRERYANRAVKIERAVIRDQDDNYVNHGTWRMWDTKGTLVAQGEYANGKRHGNWTMWYYNSNAPILRQVPFREFVGPFVSQATFKDGELHGAWTIYDGKKRKVAEWNYANGLRHGSRTTFYVNGNKMEEIEFDTGELHGSFRRWAANAKITMDNQYDHGRTTGRKATQYQDRKTKSEGMYLLARQELSGKDDWWNLDVGTYVKHGHDERHGEWQSWYSNGQLQVQAKYEHDRPASGSVWAWWYENGQQAVEGRYQEGHQHGRWIWWHTNGQKKLQGAYVRGEPSGQWIWWKTDGMVQQKMDFSAIATEKNNVPSKKLETAAREQSVLSVPLNAAIPHIENVQ